MPRIPAPSRRCGWRRRARPTAWVGARGESMRFDNGEGCRLVRRMIAGWFWRSLVVIAPVASARAQSVVSEVRFGILAHDVPVLGAQKEHGADLNGEVLFVSPVPARAVAGVADELRWLLMPRPDVGIDANTSDYTSQVYLGLTWTASLAHGAFTANDGVFAGFGFGAAFNNGYIETTDSNHLSLGSHVLFHSSLEIGYSFDPAYSVSVYFEHSSNAGLAARNEGLSDLGVRFGIRF